MHVLSVLLLGVSTNLDNLMIGFSFGLQRRKVTLLSNALIGLFSASVTCLFCYFSSLVAGLGRIPNLIGGIFIVLMGLYSLFATPPGCDETEQVTEFTWKDTAVLGSGLALNCIPVAFGAGLTGISPWAASLSVGLVSVLSIGLGNRIGLRATDFRLSAKMLNVLGGLIMVVLGAMEIFI